MRSGRVVRMDGSRAHVDLGGEVLPCHIRGMLAKEARRVGTNAVAVGDRVRVAEGATGQGDAVIEEVLPRSNKLARASAGPRGTRREQVICANVDRLVAVCSVGTPALNTRFLDRLLVAGARGNLKVAIVINKIDLGGEEAAREAASFYAGIGYKLHFTSALRGEGVEELRELLRDATTVFAGPSGVGKSALANAVQPGLRLETGNVSDATGKGRHTTTGVVLLPLSFGGYLLDTPGLRELGLWDLTLEDMTVGFPEIAQLADRCEYGDCRHGNEPGCAVREAVDREVPRERWVSWCNLIEEFEERRRREGEDKERDFKGTRRKPPPAGGKRKNWRPGRFASGEEDYEELEE